MILYQNYDNEMNILEFNVVRWNLTFFIQYFKIFNDDLKNIHGKSMEAFIVSMLFDFDTSIPPCETIYSKIPFDPTNKIETSFRIHKVTTSFDEKIFCAEIDFGTYKWKKLLN